MRKEYISKNVVVRDKRVERLARVLNCNFGSGEGRKSACDKTPEELLQEIIREENKAPASKDWPGTSYGFSPVGYNQIILFTNEKMFQMVVAANPHMKAIIGADDHTKEMFPGVFLAGVKTIHQINRTEMELLETLGESALKDIGEQITEVVRQHNLQKSPDVCRKLFDYMSGVINGWNSV